MTAAGFPVQEVSGVVVRSFQAFRADISLAPVTAPENEENSHFNTLKLGKSAFENLEKRNGILKMAVKQVGVFETFVSTF